jgi:hypothetical protein
MAAFPVVSKILSPFRRIHFQRSMVPDDGAPPAAFGFLSHMLPHDLPTNMAGVDAADEESVDRRGERCFSEQASVEGAARARAIEKSADTHGSLRR